MLALVQVQARWDGQISRCLLLLLVPEWAVRQNKGREVLIAHDFDDLEYVAGYNLPFDWLG